MSYFFKLHLFICALFSLNSLSGQTASQKSITEACDCVKKIDPALSEDQRTGKAMQCMTVPIKKYMPDLKSEMKVTETDERAAGMAIGKNLAPQLFQQCPEIAGYLTKMISRGMPQQASASSLEKDTFKLDPKTCLQYRAGKYTAVKLFVNGNLLENPDKSTYSEIKEGYLLDYSNNGNTTTKWSVKYTADCEWQQTLVESNDPNVKNVFKVGDSIQIKAVGSTKENGLWVDTKFAGMSFLVLLNKIN